MSVYRTANDEGTGVLVNFFGDEVEYANAIEFMSESKIHEFAAMRYEICLANDPEYTKSIPGYFFIRQAKIDWEKIFGEIVASGVPTNIQGVFNAKTKSEQEKLLQNQSLTTYQLGALFFKSAELGYTFSVYKGERLPSSIDPKTLPHFIGVEKDKVIKRGPTPLSDGQLKMIIQQRTAIVARILDKGSEWHCFFQTFKSMRGQESWQGGQPHLHYISDKWGIPRTELVQQIREGRHPSTRVHIALYRNDNDEQVSS